MKHHSFLFLKLLTAALILPAVIPTSFLGVRFDYQKNSFLQEIKSEELTRNSRFEKISDGELSRVELSKPSESESQIESPSSSPPSRSSSSRRASTDVLGVSFDNRNKNSGTDVGNENTSSRRVSITVHKFLDGSKAVSEATTDSFKMVATYGDGDDIDTVSYELDESTKYMSVLAVPSGVDFTTSEVVRSEDVTEDTSNVFSSSSECRALPCAGDLNHNGVVDGLDVSILINNWGATEDEDGVVVLGDVTGDGIVDAADLGMLLSQWGVCKGSTAYTIDGYGWGDTLEDASTQIMSRTEAKLLNLSKDQVVVVWNSTCEPDIALMCDPSINLVKNGSFEDVVVTNDAGWDILDTNDGIGWIVAWLGGNAQYEGENRPNPAFLEVQAGVNGWLSKDGKQHAELDSDWFGPTHPLNGEPASIKMYQDIATIPSEQYELSFSYSPRPGTDQTENYIEVSRNDVSIFSNSVPSQALHTEWNNVSQTFTADSRNTRIMFSDIANKPNSLGILLDNVSFRCMPEKEDPADVEEGNGDTEDGESNNGSSGNNGGSNNNGNNSSGNNNNNNPSVLGAQIVDFPEVLGAMTCSERYLNSYIKYGANNSTEEVKKLQIFLNKFQAANLPVTGYYGPQTRESVNKFQIFHNMFVLAPWVNAGLMTDDNTPTGYVYKTTQRWINLLECPVLGLPMPVLP